MLFKSNLLFKEINFLNKKFSAHSLVVMKKRPSVTGKETAILQREDWST